MNSQLRMASVFLSLLFVPILGLSQGGGTERATGPDHTSRAQVEAERRRAEQDEANRRAAAAAEQAELAEDRRIMDTGGIVRIKRSAELWSGEGKDFSPWYFLASDPAPKGYLLKDAIFRLVGDRSCGSWAECAEAGRNPSTVLWKFRMQGHDENHRLEIRSFILTFAKTDDPNDHGGFTPKIDVRIEGRKATSVGVLKTRYLRELAPGPVPMFQLKPPPASTD